MTRPARVRNPRSTQIAVFYRPSLSYTDNRVGRRRTPAREPDVPSRDAPADRPTRLVPSRSRVMNPEHVIVPSQTEVRLVETIDHTARRAEPSAEQQQTADDVFTRDQEQMVAALLA